MNVHHTNPFKVLAQTRVFFGASAPREIGSVTGALFWGGGVGKRGLSDPRLPQMNFSEALSKQKKSGCMQGEKHKNKNHHRNPKQGTSIGPIKCLSATANRWAISALSHEAKLHKRIIELLRLIKLTFDDTFYIRSQMNKSLRQACREEGRGKHII